jgi:hypothetical protein
MRSSRRRGDGKTWRRWREAGLLDRRSLLRVAPPSPPP